MSANHLFDLDLPDERATRDFAAALSPRLKPGDVLLLSGQIGAGKTVFARQIIQSRLASAGLFEDVPSPTYTLVQTYWDGSNELVHADLYRLAPGGEDVELGLEELFNHAICLVEWPDRLSAAPPNSALSLNFSLGVGEKARHLTLSGEHSVWADRLAEIAKETARA